MLRVLFLFLALPNFPAAAPVPETVSQTVKDMADAHRAERDVTAQESMAEWTLVMGVTSIVGTFLTFGAAGAALWSVHLSRRALGQAEESVERTVEIGEAQARAYVHASAASFSSESADILVSVTNTGQTPAAYFQIGGEVVLVDEGKVGEAIQLKDYEKKEWPALGAQDTLKVKLGASSKIMNKFINADPGTPKNLLVMGVISYGDVFGFHFETGFAFFVKAGEAHFRRPVSNLRAFERTDPPKGKELYWDRNALASAAHRRY